jgi:hypothetical protein
MLQSDEGGDAAALLELSFLMTFCKDAKHFAVQAVLGSGQNGIVFAVKCTHVDFPFPDRVRGGKRGDGWALRGVQRVFAGIFASHGNTCALGVCVPARSATTSA